MGRDERSYGDLARGVALEGVLLGGFVSLTSAGRLVASHIVFTTVFWGFLPLLQMAAVAAAVRAAAPRERALPPSRSTSTGSVRITCSTWSCRASACSRPTCTAR